MTSFRLAHCSDLHFTLAPWAAGLASLRGKRLAGTLGYLSRGLAARFQHNAERIGALLDDLDAHPADHVLCTGDVTSSMFEGELRGLAALLGDRLARPDRWTIIPGNHDRYVVEPNVGPRAFERTFGAVAPGEYPAVKYLTTGTGGSAERLRLVLLDASRPTALTDSSGRLGPEQRARAAQLLAEDPRTATVVALHYGLLRHHGRLDRARHGLRDAPELLHLLEATPARIALVLHGHMHRAFTISTGRHPIICAGSAIDLASDPGWFAYDIDLDTLAVTVTRRRWSQPHHRFEPDDPSPFQRALDRREAYRIPRL